MPLLNEIKDKESKKTSGSVQALTDTKTRDNTEKDYYDSKWLKERFSTEEINLLKKEFGITSDSALRKKVESMSDYDLDVLLNRLKNPGTNAYPGYEEPAKQPSTNHTTSPSSTPTISKEQEFENTFRYNKNLKGITDADFDLLKASVGGKEIEAKKMVINLPVHILDDIITREIAEKASSDILSSPVNGNEPFKAPSALPDGIKPSMTGGYTDSGTSKYSELRNAMRLKGITNEDYEILKRYYGSDEGAKNAILTLGWYELREQVKAAKKMLIDETLKGNTTGYDVLEGMLKLLGLEDIWDPYSNAKIPEPSLNQGIDLNSGQGFNDKLDNSFWEAHPEFYQIALQKMREANDAEIQFNSELAEKIPGWNDMTTLEQNQIKEGIKKIEDKKYKFPKDFIRLYEKWKKLKSEINLAKNTISKTKLDIEQLIRELSRELDTFRDFKKYSQKYDSNVKFDASKLLLVIGDSVQLAYYVANIQMTPPSAIAETLASLGLDFADFLDSISYVTYLEEKTKVENKIVKLKNQNVASQVFINTYSSRDNNNTVFDYTVADLESAMEQRYPGMKRRYEEYLNRDIKPTWNSAP